VDLEQVEVTRKQQCEALVQQVKQPLTGRVARATNLFGFSAVLFADFDRL